jgi:hypothetical protein
MDVAEIAWRGRSAARTLADRVRLMVTPPAWNRRRLADLLTAAPELRAVRAALEDGDWSKAHRQLSRHFVDADPRFVIGAGMRRAVETSLRSDFPSIADVAARTADQVVKGTYDLLAYRGLRFGSGPMPDWSYDPVNEKRPQPCYWSDVRYLDPSSCGDHKIIWELNRHQHWLTLGRAYWLTGASRYRERFIGELESWLQANPPLVGINWASMLELALRSLSWLWSLHFFVDATDGDRQPWTVDLLLGLDGQLRQIERHLSVYFSPNTHLLGEALTLYVTGRALPELSASARRQAIGRTLLVRELDRQVASDGGHLERSTHYHRYTLDFFILASIVARITGDPVAAIFDRAVTKLAGAARLMTDDRGRAPHIGDDDGGVLMSWGDRELDDFGGSLAVAAALTGHPEFAVGTTPEEVRWMLSHPVVVASTQAAPSAGCERSTRSGALPETGYYVSRGANGDHIVIDGGKHGYQNGGHAHADALSLTCTLRGVPLLIDPGTGCYTTSPVIRDRFRSTALHNTLTINGCPQSVPRGPFHWEQTADGRVHAWRTAPAFDFFDGSHDGYRPREHRRRILVLHGDLLIVADRVNGDGRAEVHWHLDPRWVVEVRGGRVTLRCDALRAGLTVPRGIIDRFSGDHATGLGWYSAVYGRIEPTTTIRITLDASEPFWMFSVFDFDPANVVAAVEPIEPRIEAGMLDHAAALKISRENSVDYFVVAEPTAAQSSYRVAADRLRTDARMLLARTNRGESPRILAVVGGSAPRQPIVNRDKQSCAELQAS